MTASLTMRKTAATRGDAGAHWQRYWLSFACYGLVTIGGLILLHLASASDYVGLDNDDTMRLVQVRNFLGGQAWFDLMEHRLGLDGGTLMHWSRLIDLPIAALIRLFGLVLEPQRAEAAALFAWPLFLSLPTLAVLGLGGRRLGGVAGMHVAFGLASLMLVTGNRFLPGSIDHHNVQLLLVAVIAVMLTDSRYRIGSFAVAGLAAAAALAIGVETTPLVAVSCLLVAVLWAWHGVRFARAAAAFGLVLTLSVSALFVATVPPQRYADIACDALSLGYYGIASVGGTLLFLAAIFGSKASRSVRFGLLAGIGASVFGTALILAPECLRNPLADLDPLLTTMWLNSVIEAQSFLSQLAREPGTFGGFYAVGFLALMVSVFRIVRGDRVETHAILLPLLLVSWGIGLVQVRGTIFATLLSILPLSMLIAQLRVKANRDPENLGAGVLYLATALMAVPSVWAVMGVLAFEGTKGITGRLQDEKIGSETKSTDCTSKAALSQLAGLGTGVVAAPSDLGVHILRFTSHRVLAAPYHRNQGGMLTELHIGLSTPEESAAFLKGAGVSWLAYCPSNSQTLQIAEMKTDGLYADLEKGKVPPYLEPLPQPTDTGITIFKVHPERM